MLNSSVTPLLGRYLRRPYGKVDRARLKRKLMERCIAQGAVPLYPIHKVQQPGMRMDSSTV